MSIRQAAFETQISYPTAKAINRIYKQEDRIDKKKVRERKPRTIKVPRLAKAAAKHVVYLTSS